MFLCNRKFKKSPSPVINIRPATIKDWENIYSLVTQVWESPNKKLFKNNFKKCLGNNSIFFIAQSDSTIVGSLMLHLQHKVIRNGAIAGFIEEVVVDEPYRGNKIGQKLVTYATSYAFNLGCYKVTLSCFPERIEFYKRCGYNQESVTMRHDG